MEGLELDSTNEILNQYKPNDIKDDDISIYSDGDSIFNSPSIEMGRSAIRNNKIPSPFKTYGMGQSPSLSPSKKMRNDYQDHLNKMRGSSNTGSPLKKNAYDLSEYNDFDDLKGMSGINGGRMSVSDSTMDREIQRLLDMSSIKLPELQEKHETDRTELLIKETHKLINTVPSSITSSKEGEAYQKILATSINKLIKQVEDMKRDLERKDTEVKNSRIQVSNLEMKLSLHQKLNSDLKRENTQLRRRPSGSQKDSRENELLRTKLIKYRNLYTEVNRENQELKLRIGGESLETPIRSKTPMPTSPASQATPREQESRSGITSDKKTESAQNGYRRRLLELQSQLSDIINDAKDDQPQQPPQLEPQDQYQKIPESNTILDSQPSLHMLALFEDLVRVMKKESVENIQSQTAKADSKKNEQPQDREETQIPIGEPEQNKDSIMDKILDSIDKNNQMYDKLIGVLSHNAPVPGAHEPPNAQLADASREAVAHRDNDREKDIVFQCYVCCPQNHHLHAKKPCKRCLAVSAGSAGSSAHSSQSAPNSSSNSSTDGHFASRERIIPTHAEDPADSRDKTINLMGEYKWTI